MGDGVANDLVEGGEAFNIFAEGANDKELGFGLGVGEEEVAGCGGGVACGAGEFNEGGEGVLEGRGEVGVSGFIGGACDEEVEDNVVWAKCAGCVGVMVSGFGVVAVDEEGAIGCGEGDVGDVAGVVEVFAKGVSARGVAVGEEEAGIGVEVIGLFLVEDAVCKGDNGVWEYNGAGVGVEGAVECLGGGDVVGGFVDFGEGLGAEVEGGVGVALDLKVDVVAFDHATAVARHNDGAIGVVGAGVDEFEGGDGLGDGEVGLTPVICDLDDGGFGRGF